MDPFLDVKKDVEKNLIKSQNLKKQLEKKPNGTDSNFLKDQLKSTLKSIKDDLEDLDETINVIQRDPGRFNLNHFEVNSRKDLLESLRKDLKSLDDFLNDLDRNQLFSTKQQSQQNFDYQPQLQKEHLNNKSLIENEQQQQQLLFKTQDKQLDGVYNTVVNLKEVAHVMGREIDDQARLIDDIEIQVDTTQHKLNHGIKKVNDFIKANSNSKQQCTIIFLIIALVILLIMVFSM
ncbi:Syntaxin-6 [Lobulomyces angularis]|nr:Syntaxin-6 [Lobulomyces angularis]